MTLKEKLIEIIEAGKNTGESLELTVTNALGYLQDELNYGCSFGEKYILPFMSMGRNSSINSEYIAMSILFWVECHLNFAGNSSFDTDGGVIEMFDRHITPIETFLSVNQE